MAGQGWLFRRHTSADSLNIAALDISPYPIDAISQLCRSGRERVRRDETGREVLARGATVDGAGTDEAWEWEWMNGRRGSASIAVG